MGDALKALKAGERLGASSRLEVPLGPIDEWMDGYGAHVRRSQLVEALYATAVRSSARSRALRQMPFLRPATQLAPTCRRTQLALVLSVCSVGLVFMPKVLRAEPTDEEEDASPPPPTGLSPGGSLAGAVLALVTGLAQGAYVVRVLGETFAETRRMVVVR